MMDLMHLLNATPAGWACMKVAYGFIFSGIGLLGTVCLLGHVYDKGREAGQRDMLEPDPAEAYVT